MDLNTIVLCAIAGLGIYLAYLIGKMRGKHITHKEVQLHRNDAIKRSRSALTGQISEQLAPYFPNFPFKPTEARFIGKPIDFIVFEGLDQDKVTNVAFVEVKSGDSALTKREQSVKEAIENKKISWTQYDILQPLKK